jgi:hypothetical protein
MGGNEAEDPKPSESQAPIEVSNKDLEGLRTKHTEEDSSHRDAHDSRNPKQAGEENGSPSALDNNKTGKTVDGTSKITQEGIAPSEAQKSKIQNETPDDSVSLHTEDNKKKETPDDSVSLHAEDNKKTNNLDDSTLHTEDEKKAEAQDESTFGTVDEKKTSTLDEGTLRTADENKTEAQDESTFGTVDEKKAEAQDESSEKTPSLKLRDEVIVECMNGCKPIKACVTSSDSKASFEKKRCEGCPYRAQCYLSEQKNTNVVQIPLKTINTRIEQARMLDGRVDNTSHRAAIEGTNSACKRMGMGKLKVRGLDRCRVNAGLIIIAQNASRVFKHLKKKAADFVKNPKFHSATSVLGAEI